MTEGIIEVVCSNNPEHKGTAIELTFKDGETTCHSHAEQRVNIRALEKEGGEAAPCTADDECTGTLRRAPRPE